MIAPLPASPSPAPAASGSPVALAAAGARPIPAESQPLRRSAAPVETASVAVESFHDEATQREVVRVADRTTGRVIAQAPSAELLRFFASAREGATALVRVEA